MTGPRRRSASHQQGGEGFAAQHRPGQGDHLIGELRLSMLVTRISANRSGVPRASSVADRDIRLRHAADRREDGRAQAVVEAQQLAPDGASRGAAETTISNGGERVVALDQGEPVDVAGDAGDRSRSRPHDLDALAGQRSIICAADRCRACARSKARHVFLAADAALLDRGPGHSRHCRGVRNRIPPWPAQTSTPQARPAVVGPDRHPGPLGEPVPIHRSTMTAGRVDLRPGRRRGRRSAAARPASGSLRRRRRPGRRRRRGGARRSRRRGLRRPAACAPIITAPSGRAARGSGPGRARRTGCRARRPVSNESSAKALPIRSGVPRPSRVRTAP